MTSFDHDGKSISEQMTPAEKEIAEGVAACDTLQVIGVHAPRAFNPAWIEGVPTPSTQGTLNREQVEMELMGLLNGVGVGGNILAHDAALRATITQQAQELAERERKLVGLCHAHGTALIEIHDLKQQLAASQARCLEMEEKLNQSQEDF